MSLLDDFMVRATLAGLGVVLAAAPLGCFVVWRRMAYFGDATAHASILGVALALTFNVSIFGGVLSVALIMALTVFYIILGMFLDGISSVVLTMAIVEPMIRQAGIDVLWFGIFIVVVVEMAQVTPPIGFNLFVLQGMTKHEISYISKTALPMVGLMALMIVILVIWPELATWLPDNIRAR